METQLPERQQEVVTLLQFPYCFCFYLARFEQLVIIGVGSVLEDWLGKPYIVDWDGDGLGPYAGEHAVTFDLQV